MNLTRVCEGPGCPVILDATFRADARFCSPLCRSRKWHESRTEPFREATNGKSERRPSRDGSGTRMYVTSSDLTAFWQAVQDSRACRNGHSTPDLDRLTRKAQEAARRINSPKTRNAPGK